MSYRVWVRPQALEEIAALAGATRARVRRAIDGLAQVPRPSGSARLTLKTSAAEAGVSLEARRLRLDHWRVVYLVDDAERWVVIVAVRRRPPYDYQDLEALTSG